MATEVTAGVAHQLQTSNAPLQNREYSIKPKTCLPRFIKIVSSLSNPLRSDLSICATSKTHSGSGTSQFKLKSSKPSLLEEKASKQENRSWCFKWMNGFAQSFRQRLPSHKLPVTHLKDYQLLSPIKRLHVSVNWMGTNVSSSGIGTENQWRKTSKQKWAATKPQKRKTSLKTMMRKKKRAQQKMQQYNMAQLLSLTPPPQVQQPYQLYEYEQKESLTGSDERNAQFSILFSHLINQVSLGSPQGCPEPGRTLLLLFRNKWYSEACHLWSCM